MAVVTRKTALRSARLIVECCSAYQRLMTRTIFEKPYNIAHCVERVRRFGSAGRHRQARCKTRLFKTASRERTGLFYTDFRNTRRALCQVFGTASVPTRGTFPCPDDFACYRGGGAVTDKPVALNTRCFQSEQNNEYLLHYRRSGRRHRSRRLSWTASLTNFFANRIFECLKCGN